MTDPPPTNAFDADLPATQARTASEARIEDLRAQGGVFVEAVRATRMPMVLADPTLPGIPIVFANDAFLHLTGYTMGEVLGQSPHFMNGAETDPEDARLFEDALERGQDIELETIQYRKDGAQLSLAVFCRALSDESGKTTAHFLSYFDVTRRTNAERQVREHADQADRQLEARTREVAKREERIRESEEQYSLIVEGARGYAIFTADPEGRVEEWYQGAETVFGWTRDEARGQLMEITFTPEDIAQGVPGAERETAKREGVAPDIRWHVRKDGSRAFIDGRTVALLGPDGVLRGFLKIGQDITERRRSQQRQATLLAELQHRVRNVLAMVTSVARRSSAGRLSVEDYREHLTGRLAAMARTQVLLTRGADSGVDLETLVRDEVIGQCGQESQLSITGPVITLAPKAAEVLTLAIHELATNAIKYGALGEAGGLVEVDWSRSERGQQAWLHLNWVESGVSAVNLTPLRQGFGTELITRRVPFELNGHASLEHKPGGVHCRMEFPLVEGRSILQVDETASPASERGLG